MTDRSEDSNRVHDDRMPSGEWKWEPQSTDGEPTMILPETGSNVTSPDDSATASMPTVGDEPRSPRGTWVKEQLPPIIPPAGNDTAAESPKPSHRKRNIIIGTAIAIILILAAAGAGYAYADTQVRKGVESAESYARQTDQRLTDKITEAQTLVDETTPDQVADENVLDMLKNTLASAGKQSGVKKLGGNPYMVWTLLDAERSYDKDAQDAQTVIKQLDERITAVNESIDRKTHDTAKQALQQTLDTAKQTLADTDGRVADNKTRETLQTTIDTAQKTLDSKNATAEDYNEQKTALDNAVKTVNDSKTAKEQADAEAAQAHIPNGSGAGYADGTYTGGDQVPNYNYYGTGGGQTGNWNTGSGTSNDGGWSPTVGDHVTDSGGIWYGGQSQNGVLGYDSLGAPITPFDPSNPNGWSGSTHVNGGN